MPHILLQVLENAYYEGSADESRYENPLHDKMPSYDGSRAQKDAALVEEAIAHLRNMVVTSENEFPLEDQVRNGTVAAREFLARLDAAAEADAKAT